MGTQQHLAAWARRSLSTLQRKQFAAWALGGVGTLLNEGSCRFVGILQLGNSVALRSLGTRSVGTLRIKHFTTWALGAWALCSVVAFLLRSFGSG